MFIMLSILEMQVPTLPMPKLITVIHIKKKQTFHSYIDYMSLLSTTVMFVHLLAVDNGII